MPHVRNFLIGLSNKSVMVENYEEHNSDHLRLEHFYELFLFYIAFQNILYFEI